MMAPPMSRKLAFLFALYVCQGLPGGFLAVVLPVVLREQGLDLKTIGLASFLSAPWILKFLWAPLVDRYGWSGLGRHRSWLIPAQLGMLAVTLALSAVRPQDDLTLVVLLFLLLNVFAATQDIAVDGWAVRLLKGEELGPANSAQVGGFKVGNLVGGGVLVGLLGTIGWAGDFWLMSALIGCVLMFVILTPEPPSPKPPPRKVLPLLWASLRRQGLGFWAFIMFAKFGETFGGSLTKPMLVDHGYTKEMIAALDGVLGAGAVIAGAVVAGALVRRRGWAWTLAGCSVLQGLALVALGLLTPGSLPVALFAPINMLEAASGGGVAVCIFALGMSRADASIGATDFTAMQVMYMAGAFLAAPLGGAMGDAVGYLPVFCLSGAMAVMLGLMAPGIGRRFQGRSDTMTT